MNISIRFIKEVSYLKALTEWQSSVHDFILRLKRELQLSRIEAKEMSKTAKCMSSGC